MLKKYLIFLFFLLMVLPVMADDWMTGLNISALGSAEGTGFGYSIGEVYNGKSEKNFLNSKILSFDLGLILNDEESRNYEVDPSTTQLADVSEEGTFRNTNEIFVCAEIGASLTEKTFLTFTLGTSIESTAHLVRSNVNGQLLNESEDTKFHFIYGGNLRFHIADRFMLATGYTTRRGIKLGIDFVFK